MSTQKTTQTASPANVETPEQELERLRAEIEALKAAKISAVKRFEGKALFSKSQCRCGRKLRYDAGADEWLCPAFLTGETGKEIKTGKVTCQRFVSASKWEPPETVEIRARSRKGKEGMILSTETRQYYVDSEKVANMEAFNKRLASGEDPGFVWFREAKGPRPFHSGIFVDQSGKPGPASYVGPGSI